MALTTKEVNKLTELNVIREQTDNDALEMMIRKYNLERFNRSRSLDRGNKLVYYAWLMTQPNIVNSIKNDWDELYGRYVNPHRRILSMYRYWPDGYNHNTFMDHCWGAHGSSDILLQDSFHYHDTLISVPYDHTIPTWNELAKVLTDMGCDVQIEYPCYYGKNNLAVIIRFPLKNRASKMDSVAYQILYGRG